MKNKSSNIFAIPNWMKNLRVREPEGNKTPDEVAFTLEFNMAYHPNNVERLREAIGEQIPLVPLKHQKMLKAFLAMDDAPMVIAVVAFINQCNQLVAELKEETHDNQREEIPAESGGESSDAWLTGTGDWEDDSDLRRKPSTRGQRAVRAAKRGQA